MGVAALEFPVFALPESRLSILTTRATNLKIVLGDVYQRLWNPPQQKFDLIVIDHSPSDQLSEDENQFYTADGLTKAKAHINPDGVLAIWSCAQSSSFSEALQSEFAKVHAEPVTTQNDLVGVEQTDWLFFGLMHD